MQVWFVTLSKTKMSDSFRWKSGFVSIERPVQRTIQGNASITAVPSYSLSGSYANHEQHILQFMEHIQRLTSLLELHLGEALWMWFWSARLFSMRRTMNGRPTMRFESTMCFLSRQIKRQTVLREAMQFWSMCCDRFCHYHIPMELAIEKYTHW
jgi:hypothetical protein